MRPPSVRSVLVPSRFIDPVKASTALELARTAARIAFTFIPVILVKNHRTRKILKHVEDAKKKDPNAVFPARFDKLVENKGDVLRRIRKRTILFHGLLFTPIFLFWAAIVASLERTPLTGRYVHITMTGDLY